MHADSKRSHPQYRYKEYNLTSGILNADAYITIMMLILAFQLLAEMIDICQQYQIGISIPDSLKKVLLFILGDFFLSFLFCCRVKLVVSSLRINITTFIMNHCVYVCYLTGVPCFTMVFMDTYGTHFSTSRCLRLKHVQEFMDNDW